MLFRLFLIAVFLAVGPLAQAVDCVMAEPTPAVAPHHDCAMATQDQAPTHGMPVAECLGQKAIHADVAPLPEALPSLAASFVPAATVRPLSPRILAAPARPPPQLTGAQRLPHLGRWLI